MTLTQENPSKIYETFLTKKNHAEKADYSRLFQLIGVADRHTATARLTLIDSAANHRAVLS